MKNENFLWPVSAQCCASLTFDLDAEWVFQGDQPETAKMPKWLSLGKYVWRSNIIPRILDLLDNHNIKATFYIVGINAINHPDVIQEIHKRGHEVSCHGWKHEDIMQLTIADEEKRLLKTIEAIEKATGVTPVGHRLASTEFSPHSIDLLLKNGFLYDSSFRDCDLPYYVSKKLVEVPSNYDMDDFDLFANYPGTSYHTRMLSPQIAFDTWSNAFDGFYKYGLCYTLMFHPQIIGKPGNMMLLERLINYINKFPRVWWATAGEIALHYKHLSDDF